jgi:pyruvate formate lyase activating enzyme
MKIGEIIDISTEYTPSISSMVFLIRGCDLNCEFCNKLHLLQNEGGEDYDVKKLLALVNTNYLVKNIHITGGDPLLKDDVINFACRLNELDKDISIRTNGFHPKKIKRILPYINRIILNLKGPINRERYSQITNTYLNIDSLIESFKLLNQQKQVVFDITTEYVKNLMVPEDFHQILKFLIDNKFTGKFMLQQYVHMEGVDEDFKQKFKKPEHIDLINLLKPYVDKDLPFRIFLEDNVYDHSEIHKVFQKIIM